MGRRGAAAMKIDSCRVHPHETSTEPKKIIFKNSTKSFATVTGLWDKFCSLGPPTIFSTDGIFGIQHGPYTGLVIAVWRQLNCSRLCCTDGCFDFPPPTKTF